MRLHEIENKSIDKLLDATQKLLGTDIIINNKTYNLFYNIYLSFIKMQIKDSYIHSFLKI